jgi:hypothetical protein
LVIYIVFEILGQIIMSSSAGVLDTAHNIAHVLKDAVILSMLLGWHY